MEQARELIAFTRHLYYLTRMGAPLVETLEKIKGDIRNSRMKTAVEDLGKKLEEGESLSGAMRSHPYVFPLEYTRMIEVAEKTETLPQVLSDISVYLESVEKSRRNIRAAAMYPGLILNFALLFVFAVYYFVSKDIFYYYVQIAEKTGWEITPFTMFFINTARFLFSPVFIAILAAIVIFIDIVLFTRTAIGTDLLISLPFVSDIYKKAYTVRISRTLGYLVKQGITLDNAVEMMSKTLDSKHLGDMFTGAIERLRKGSPLSEAFRDIRLFDNTMVFMIKNGEDKENLPDALFEAADYYEQDLDSIYKGFFHLIEPAFLATVGILVGFMMVSILMPFYSITGAIQ